ncbi:MAG TPA: glycosyltransferase family 39 protein, partial [Vicinamibacterales bacterium]|nr:glycosyltransferase family 39 protein [Vicinamibacterales bacterium]
MSPFHRAALVLVLAAYLLPLAVPVPLMEDDEGLHAAIAVEMVERGDWIVPRLLTEPFLDKPILYFWMQAGSLATFGPSEFAVRLPGTLMALAAVAATGWLATLLFGGTAGWWAALCYATMLLPYAVSLAPLHDLVMVPLVTVALGAFWRASSAQTASALARWTALAGVALGLSMLGKGLTGVGLVGVGMTTWLLWTRALSWRLVLSGAVAIAIGAAIAWPWYAAMEQASPGYLHYFFMQRHVAGVTDDTQRHAGRPFWYYLPIALAGTWPWLLAAWPRARAMATNADRLLVSWFVADFLLLSLAGSKLATYLLPALPAVAVLAGRTLSDMVAEPAPRWPRVAAVITAAVPAVGMAVLWWQGPVAPSPVTAIAVLVPLAVVMALDAVAGARAAPVDRLMLVTAAALLAIALAVRPVVAEGLTARSLAAHFNAAGRVPARVWIVDEGVGSFIFYLREDLRKGLVKGQ